VYLVIVFLSVILPMLLLSSKLKRNLIAALKLETCVTIFQIVCILYFIHFNFVNIYI
jgi:hypothetical protein